MDFGFYYPTERFVLISGSCLHPVARKKMTRSKQKLEATASPNPSKFTKPYVLVHYQDEDSFEYFNLNTQMRKKRAKRSETNENEIYVKYGNKWFPGKIINHAGKFSE